MPFPSWAAVILSELRYQCYGFFFQIPYAKHHVASTHNTHRPRRGTASSHARECLPLRPLLARQQNRRHHRWRPWPRYYPCRRRPGGRRSRRMSRHPARARSGRVGSPPEDRQSIGAGLVVPQTGRDGRGGVGTSLRRDRRRGGRVRDAILRLHRLRRHPAEGARHRLSAGRL